MQSSQKQNSDIPFDLVAEAVVIVLSNLFPVNSDFKLQLNIFSLVIVSSI